MHIICPWTEHNSKNWFADKAKDNYIKVNGFHKSIWVWIRLYCNKFNIYIYNWFSKHYISNKQASVDITYYS